MTDGPIIDRFPLFVPLGFEPSDVDGDGLDRAASGRICPGYSVGHAPRWGGGFDAPRGPRRIPHHAVDIMAAEGVTVRAISACRVVGTVTVIRRDAKTGAVLGRETMPGAGTSAKGGNYVYLEDVGGWRWYYAHLRDVPLVTPGMDLASGETIGYVGRTGNAVRRVRAVGGLVLRGCPHLHLSLADP